MCQECGCGLGAHDRESGNHHGDRVDPRGHDHRSHFRAASPVEVKRAALSDPGGTANGGTRLVEIQRSLLERNQRLADRNRGLFRARNLLVLNMVSAPGSGKTALIEKTGERLRSRLRLGVIVGDLETDNDARRLRAAGLPVVPISTGTLCHLEAEMVARASEELDLDRLDVLVIENVGNLVCPAAYDLGEDLRVVLTSVTEGEDKPLKYPPLFHSAEVALVTKMDLGGLVGFDRETALANLKHVSHHARIFEVSAKTGEGMDAWAEFLVEQAERVRRAVSR